MKRNRYIMDLGFMGSKLGTWFGCEKRLKELYADKYPNQRFWQSEHIESNMLNGLFWTRMNVTLTDVDDGIESAWVEICKKAGLKPKAVEDFY